MKKILFVCMGNICRSPTAEYVMRERLAVRGLADEFDVESCGTHAYHTGHGADSRSVAAARARGYDMRGHRARRVSPDDFAAFDHVLAMDRDNLSILRQLCPDEHAERVELFLEYLPDDSLEEVPDPYFGEAGFDRVLDLIEAATEGFLAAHAPKR